MAIKMGIEKEELLDYKVRCKLLEMLHIPVYENVKLNIFCFKFHDVMIGILIYTFLNYKIIFNNSYKNNI